MTTNIKSCRLCSLGSENLVTVINLGDQYITSRFPTLGDFSTPRIPITLCMCKGCGLLQLLQTTAANEMYEHEYGYRSGISNTMRAHLKAYQAEIVSKIALNAGDTIVDIGSNDSTMLQYYDSTLCRIGVDPTGSQFREHYGSVNLLADYFTRDNFVRSFQDKKAKVISSISMFYDIPDPVQFAKDVHSILEDDGLWTCEQSYLPSMLKTNSVDTICHEHLEYYSLRQIKDIADRAGFKICDVLFNDCNGGSFRIYMAKKTSVEHAEAVELLSRILEEEDTFGMKDAKIYDDFMKRVDEQVKSLLSFIRMARKDGKEVWIYGASTKGNCLLQYAGIDSSMIPYAVERNLSKVGKMTSTGTEIISEDRMRLNPPSYLLVLPWHFREEIIQREAIFLLGGGHLVFPFPVFSTVGNVD